MASTCYFCHASLEAVSLVEEHMKTIHSIFYRRDIICTIQILEDTTVSSLLELFHTQDDTEETIEAIEKEPAFEDMSNLYKQDIKQFINSLPKSVNYNTILIEKVDCGTMTENLMT